MKKIFLICISFCLLLSGCSYKDVEDSVRGKILNDNVDEPQSLTVPQANLSKIEMLKIGDTMSDYYKLPDGSEAGIRGLTYTLNKVECFSSIYESGIDIKETEFDTASEDFFRDNGFILADITASYKAQDGGEKEVTASVELYGSCDYSKAPDLGEKDESMKMEPYTIYFSEHPKEGDERLDSEGQYMCYIIKDGETLNFKLGLLAASEFIDGKNALLVRGSDSAVVTIDDKGNTHTTEQDMTGRIFDLFG